MGRAFGLADARLPRTRILVLAVPGWRRPDAQAFQIGCSGSLSAVTLVVEERGE